MSFLHFLNQGWIGALIGIIGLWLAIYFYRKSKVKSKPAYQQSAIDLLGTVVSQLPPQVSVVYEQIPVTRLTRTTLVFWNAGSEVLHGTDVVNDDRVRVVLNGEGDILAFSTIRVTKKANKIEVYKKKDGYVYVHFDYLDPGDGATIELLHTSDKKYVTLAGTVKGVPAGLADLGRPAEGQSGFPPTSTVLIAWPFLSTLIALAGMLVLNAVVFFILDSPPPPLEKLSSFLQASIAAGGGLVVMGVGLSALCGPRKKFPRALDTDSLTAKPEKRTG